MNDTPSPGSHEAISQGCSCPILDNHGGAGRPMGDRVVFVYSEGCSVHKHSLEDVTTLHMDDCQYWQDPMEEPCTCGTQVMKEGA